MSARVRKRTLQRRVGQLMRHGGWIALCTVIVVTLEWLGSWAAADGLIRTGYYGLGVFDRVTSNVLVITRDADDVAPPGDSPLVQLMDRAQPLRVVWVGAEAPSTAPGDGADWIHVTDTAIVQAMIPSGAELTEQIRLRDDHGDPMGLLGKVMAEIAPERVFPSIEWVAYGGASGSLPTLPLAAALEGHYPLSTFKGKVVVMASPHSA